MPPDLPPRLPAGRPDSHAVSQAATASLTPGSDSQPSAMTNLLHPYGNYPGIVDNRTSSTQSLLPAESQGDKRILLLIYIHGFMGAEISFKSFPAHVHSLLTISLAGSHVIHTKVYPRYESRRKIDLARDNFSKWLLPHESHETDVVILGHSLGGILGAEVVLLPASFTESTKSFRHRILGLVAFDTPFLGIHPGVITTGIASLFKPGPNPAKDLETLSSHNSSEVFDSFHADPNYNPAFTNDVRLPIRNNKWDRAWYFWTKHADHLGKATKSYVKSYFEFGGCLADYPGLRRRYETIRALEDIDEIHKPQVSGGQQFSRVRFVNYYTASTGNVKQVKTASEADDSTISKGSSTEPAARGSSLLDTHNLQEQEQFICSDQMQDDQSRPIATSNTPASGIDDPISVEDQAFSDSHAPQTAVKDEPEPALPQTKDEKKKHNKAPPKERKFCSLPKHDPKGEKNDLTWVKVDMEGVDEVVAHTSLFDISDTYAKLVGDTAERIADWVHDAATARVILSER